MEQKITNTSIEIVQPYDGSILPEPVQETVSPKPVEKADRIQTIDVIRGFALCGILMMNIIGFGIDGSVFYEMINAPVKNIDYYTFLVIGTGFEGTMRGLFSMLFGAGMILFTFNKKETPGGLSVAEAYYRRLMWLVLFGMINAYILLWQGDILFYYGLIGMLLYPLRKTGSKWLIMLGFCCFFINIYKGMEGWGDLREKRAKYLLAVAAEKKNQPLTDEQKGDKQAWTEIEKNQKPDTARTNRHVAKMRSDYYTVYTYHIPQNSNGEAWGMYHGIWDMLGMMLIGMGLFLVGFFSNKLSTSTYFLTLLIGYGVGLPFGWFIVDQGWVGSTLNFARYVDTFSVPHWAIYDFKRVFISLGHASLLMLIYRLGVARFLMKGLANVGQMAFTNYLMQSIICTLFFFGYGFGNYDKLRFHQLYFVVIAVWIFQLIFSAIWLRYFKFGPLEWVWRSLTYWKAQPMRIKSPTR